MKIVLQGKTETLKAFQYVIIEQAEDNEAYITHCTKEGIEDYQDLGTGDKIILTEEAYSNLCMQGAGV